MDTSFNNMDELEIEPPSDELLESVAGAGLPSDGPTCCSIQGCTQSPTPQLPGDGTVET